LKIVSILEEGAPNRI